MNKKNGGNNKAVKKKLERIYKGIKEIKIQGASNIARAALYAYSLSPNAETKKKLFSLRPTEPMLINVLHDLDKNLENKEKILMHFLLAQNKINNYVLKIIKNNDVIFTHCHSTNVIKSLINAKKYGKKFQVYNTETRPLFQGRKTASELSKAGIKVTSLIDSAVEVAIEGEQGFKKINKIFLGSDAILPNGDIINKIGSEMYAQIAKTHKIPVYIIADSWKFSKNNIKLEQRSFNEVWDKSPKNIKIKNPAFEKVDKKYITAIVSELGILKPEEFVRKVKKTI
ncbi:translation initiation factor eIF-2B [Candidatus Pacearchaeota archaeon]|nr:translation initiation factor eIF-2B [Candidatus Pacearchaeota archaeon]